MSHAPSSASSDSSASSASPESPDSADSPDEAGGNAPNAALVDDGPVTTRTPPNPARASGQRFVFVDTEATGLDLERQDLTEVSWVVRYEDGSEEERRYFPEHTLDGADEDALKLTAYWDKIAPQPRTPMKVWLTEFLQHAKDAVLVGAVPDFDARQLQKACRRLRVEPTWDHHLLDVETLALPLIADGPQKPRSLAKTCAALGVQHDKHQAHGALYDARQAKVVFDRIWDVLAELRRTDAPLPPPVDVPDANGSNDSADEVDDNLA